MEEELKPPKKGVRKPKAEKPPIAKPPKVDAPDHLTMSLFAPGMTPLHRAGLGGLACTLKAMERQHEAGLLRADKLPGAMTGNEYPWTVTDDEVTLKFDKPELAGEYLRKLFAFAFQIRDGVIYLPGQYGDVPPALAVRVALQDGVLLSLYDHGPQSRGVSQVTEESVEIDDVQIVFRVARLDWYRHQRDGADMAISSLVAPAEVSRMLYPGAVKRHYSVKSSSVVMTAKELIPVLFALVGTFALRMGAKRVVVRGKRVAKSGATLIVPEFINLNEAIELLPALLPRTVAETKATSSCDAILGAEVRLRARSLLALEGLAAVRGVWCCATNWNSQLQPPSKIIEVWQENITDRILDRYERAWASLPPRVRTWSEDDLQEGQEAAGAGYWSNSTVRPLIAENLARGQKWFSGFAVWMIGTNPATNRPYRNRLHSERGGLHAMISDPDMWDEAGERRVVEAVHEAMRVRYGQIADENRGKQTAMEGRMKRFRERLRLSLAGAKREADVRFALTDLFSRAGSNSVLREHWATVLPVIRKDWQLARDLGLLAFASYASQDTDQSENPQE